MKYLRRDLANARKDALAEWRARETNTAIDVIAIKQRIDLAA